MARGVGLEVIEVKGVGAVDVGVVADSRVKAKFLCISMLRKKDREMGYIYNENRMMVKILQR